MNRLKILDAGMAAWSKFCTDDPQTFRQYRKTFCRPDDLTPLNCALVLCLFPVTEKWPPPLASSHISVCIIIIIIIIITAAEFLFSGIRPYISRDKTNNNKYKHKRNNKI